MGEVVFHSKVRIEGLGGPDRAACLPAETDPVIYGMHGEEAEHYKVPAGAFAPAPRPSTTWSARRAAD